MVVSSYTRSTRTIEHLSGEANERHNGQSWCMVISSLSVGGYDLPISQCHMHKPAYTIAQLHVRRLVMF